MTNKGFMTWLIKDIYDMTNKRIFDMTNKRIFDMTNKRSYDMTNKTIEMTSKGNL